MPPRCGGRLSIGSASLVAVALDSPIRGLERLGVPGEPFPPFQSSLANGVEMLAIVALAAALGVAHGLGGILGILSGIGTGQQLADGLANRKWGHLRTTAN